jgi:hypothetical protein
MYLRSLANFEKASQSLKKPHIISKSLHFSENAFKKNQMLEKKRPHILKKKASWQLPHCHNG